MPIIVPSFDEREVTLLRQCLDSGWVTQGPMVERFEAMVASRHGAKHALACTSCTAALHLATGALDLGPGDEVLVPAFTWVTSAHCAEYVGAAAKFVDIDPETFNIDVSALAASITPRTRAIVAVHLFGLAAEMDPILAIAQRHNLAVIEDAACAIGTTYKGRPVGALGTLGCFSFHPRKIVTTGEGGLVSTNDDALAARLQSLRNHGSTGQPSPEIEPHGPWTMATFERVGFNYRLSDIGASVGIAQMEKLEIRLAERRAAAERYDALLAQCIDLRLPSAARSVAGHTYQSYVVRVIDGGRPRRNHVMRRMAEAGILSRPGTHAVHRLGYYRTKYSLRAEDFPAAAAAEDTTITLPIFPEMTELDQEVVAVVLNFALSEKPVD